MQISQPISGNTAIGDQIAGGLDASILYVDPANVIAQDNPSFTYTTTFGEHIGNTPGTTNVNVGGYGLEVSGNNNTEGGINIILSNTSTGISAFTSLFLQNNLANVAGTHYGNIGMNSSTYNDNTFGTAVNVANQLAVTNTDGPIMFGAFNTGQIINFVVGGANTTNEIARFTSSGFSQSLKTIKYNNINTTGWGQPAIYGTGRLTGQTAAIASVATYTVGAADGSFIVSANVNVTAFAVGTFNVNCVYTDETNTTNTFKMNFSSVTGTLGIAIAAAGAFEGISGHIRAKAGTTITVTTTGTFTSLTYNVEGIIQQIA